MRSAAAVIPLLRGSAAGGCAEGRRSVEKKKSEERRERECLGATATAATAAACKEATEGETETEGRKTRLQDCLRGSILIPCMFLHNEKGLIRMPFFFFLSLADAFRHGLKQEACLGIV